MIWQGVERYQPLNLRDVLGTLQSDTTQATDHKLAFVTVPHEVAELINDLRRRRGARSEKYIPPEFVINIQSVLFTTGSCELVIAQQRRLFPELAVPEL